MKPLNKKLLIYGGGAFVVGISLYLLLKKKSVTSKKIEPKSKKETSKKDLPINVYTKSGTNVRKEPSTSSAILNNYKKGEILTPIDSIIKPDGLWYKVLEQGGWVRSDVVTE
jgi:uncharacterized protein YgiM (DUF1202 family)